jgi:hypothetical protein
VEDSYGSDVLAGFSRRATPRPAPEVEAEAGLVVEVVESDFVGAVVGGDRKTLRLEDRFGRVRVFPYGAGFLVDGLPVRIVPRSVAAASPARTASGSIAVENERARVALPSRIFVEGKHDAELVERVWGDDLRVEGVVVEYLGGIDDLVAIVDDFAPTSHRRIGVLVDHLVPGSKETVIADAVARGPHGAHVLVVGHPFVDVWQAVKPDRLGMAEWPTIPRSVEWKHGVCEALGWRHDSQADIAMAWKRILRAVSSYEDIEPELLGRVEELIDFVTAP